MRYPYVRGVLLELYRDALARTGDPVAAWGSIVEDEAKARRYKSQRGKGGFVRATWDEVAELVAAAHVYTIKRYGPDRIAGFSPIPAMSMVSYAAGTRFYSLIGGLVMSFYDWYADLPPASPQVWGDQTDVPESADWWNCSYLMLWGSNVPITRTPDAHFMTEARYRGQKVVVVSPDYAAHVKFADNWLPAQPGTDGALAMAMGHVILKEFFVERETPYFQQYVRKNTDLPCLVTLRERERCLCRRSLFARLGPRYGRRKCRVEDGRLGCQRRTSRRHPTAPSASAGAMMAWALESRAGHDRSCAEPVWPAGRGCAARFAAL